MAVRGQHQVVYSVPSSGDLSASRYKFVELTTGKATVCDAATDKPLGVLQNKPEAADHAAEVCVLGFTKMVAGAAITAANTLITTDNAGKAVPVVPGTDTTKYILGTALTTASGDGIVVDVFVNCMNPARAA